VQNRNAAPDADSRARVERVLARVLDHSRGAAGAAGARAGVRGGPGDKRQATQTIELLVGRASSAPISRARATACSARWPRPRGRRPHLLRALGEAPRASASRAHDGRPIASSLRERRRALAATLARFARESSRATSSWRARRNPSRSTRPLLLGDGHRASATPRAATTARQVVAGTGSSSRGALAATCSTRQVAGRRTVPPTSRSRELAARHPARHRLGRAGAAKLRARQVAEGVYAGCTGATGAGRSRVRRLP